MAGILRGGIYWAEMPPAKGHEQSGKRPVLVLSNDAFNKASQTAIVMPLTGSRPKTGFPLSFEIECKGLPKRSWVKVSQIATISYERIESHIADAPESEVATALEGLMNLLE